MVVVVLHRRGASAGLQIAVRRLPFVTGGGIDGGLFARISAYGGGLYYRLSPANLFNQPRC